MLFFKNLFIIFVVPFLIFPDVISGTIFDSISGNPVAGAKVAKINGKLCSTFTNSQGNFSLEILIPTGAFFMPRGSKPEDLSCKLMDVKGRVLLTGQDQPKFSSLLPPGLYVAMIIKTNGKKETEKLFSFSSPYIYHPSVSGSFAKKSAINLITVNKEGYFPDTLTVSGSQSISFKILSKSSIPVIGAINAVVDPAGEIKIKVVIPQQSPAGGMSFSN